jgi:hypothetical protein
VDQTKKKEISISNDTLDNGTKIEIVRNIEGTEGDQSPHRSPKKLEFPGRRRTLKSKKSDSSNLSKWKNISVGNIMNFKKDNKVSLKESNKSLHTLKVPGLKKQKRQN